MGKTKSNFRRFIKIIFNPLMGIKITLIISIIILIILSTFNQRLQKENAHLKYQLNNLKTIYNQKTEEIKDVETAITTMKNIDNHIIEIKKTFFANAKKYEDIVLAGRGTKKIVYLTIDDGPYNLTNYFLDTLDKRDVLATFFLLGKPDDRYDVIYKRIASSGHTVANHTYSHNVPRLYSNKTAFIDDVLKQEKFLEDKLGVKTNIVRFPGGAHSAAKKVRTGIATELRQRRYGYIDWNVSAGDCSRKSNVTTIYNNVINGVLNNKVSVVLMHDFSLNTSLALPLIIETLEKQDCIFLPLFYESAVVRK
jgi:peptidoglycan/xylan/chitin deacetylase (PgdA/CDA1 family)